MTHLRHKHMKKYHPIQAFFNVLWRLVPIFLVFALIWMQNNAVITKNYVFSMSDMPKSFVGLKIAHVSDICNSRLDIVDKVKEQNPDIILLTGGYSDSNGNYKNTVNTVNKLTKIAPVYYIYNTEDIGTELDETAAINITNCNLEIKAPNIDVNKFIERNYGNYMLKDAKNGDEVAQQYIEYVTEELSKTSDSKIIVCGIDNYNYENGAYDAKDTAWKLIGSDESLTTLMLIGNIDILDQICKTDLDLALFGNTFGTNYLSDKYKKGLYTNNSVQLFVSGGIGKHDGVTRIFNFPEFSMITLSDGTIYHQNPLERLISKIIPNVGNIFENDGGFKEFKYEFNGGQN